MLCRPLCESWHVLWLVPGPCFCLASRHREATGVTNWSALRHSLPCAAPLAEVRSFSCNCRAPLQQALAKVCQRKPSRNSPVGAQILRVLVPGDCGPRPALRPIRRAKARLLVNDCETGCPHLNRSDRRCAARFRLDSLEELFEFCCERFEGCALYYRINRELSDSETPMKDESSSTTRPIRLTIHGGTHIRSTGS